MLRSQPSRMVLTLLLAVWTPFCCCSFHVLANACSAREAGRDSAPAHAESSGVDPSHGRACCHASHGQDDSASSLPDRPTQQDNQPCMCGKDKMATFGSEPVDLEIPAIVLVCVLPDWEFPAFLQSHAFWPNHADFALHRPATSLLRMHCALTV